MIRIFELSMFDRLRQTLSSLPRGRKRALLICFDTVVLMILVWLAYLARFQAFFIPNAMQWFLIVMAPAIAIPVFIRTGLYRAVLRYLPDKAIWTILRSSTISVLLWVCLAFLASITGAEGLPRSVPLIYWLTSMAVIAGSRFGARWLLIGSPDTRRVKRTLIYGAGDAGIQLASALVASDERTVVGFISDDPGLIGRDLIGLRVYSMAVLENLVSNVGVEEVIIAAPSMTPQRQQQLLDMLRGNSVKVRVLPPIGDMASGKYLVTHVRDIDIEDLLGRPTVPPQPSLMRPSVNGKTVLITGGAGSIGTALARSIVEYQPGKIILLDTNEHGLFQTSRMLAKLTNVAIEPVLGSISDRALLDRLLKGHAVETVYHCAAYKHVHLAEINVLETIRNNVFGTHVLVSAVLAHPVENFVLISSDKAVWPAGIMGATKRWAELVVRHYSKAAASRCVFSIVRFGNVLGSSGSVVPIFREQIAAGGPVTLTDESMTRYFMSLSEAAELIVQASALAKNGDIFVLEMGQPIRIRDLAENMIILAGLSVRDQQRPNGDIEIVTMGTRPGEKIHEELFYDASGVTQTENPRILRAKQIAGVDDNAPQMLDMMKDALDASDESRARTILLDFANARM